MTIIDDLTPASTTTQIAAKLKELQAWVTTQMPEIDVTDPVFVSAVLTPWVIRLVQTDNQLSTLESVVRASSNSLASFPADKQEAVRAFIANRLGVSATSATYASGEIRIPLSSNVNPVIITTGTLFTSGGVSFQTTQSYVLQATPSVTSGDVRTLRASTNNTYIATVPVIAVTAGSSGNVLAGTSFQVSTTINALVSATADSNFVGGQDGNSLATILESVRQNTFSNSVNTRDQIIAWLELNPLIGGVKQAGVIGFGDAELKRAYHPFLPVQRAGAADLYLAATYYPVQHSQTLTAVVTGSTSTASTLHITIGRDVSPGFLQVVSVTDDATGKSITITKQERGLDMTPTLGQQLPLLSDPYHGGFSRFQTGALTCELTELGLTAGSQRSVTVTFLRVAGLDIAQNVMSGRTVRSLGGDILVRAAIPMLVNIRVELQSQFETLTPDVAAMQAAVVSEVASRPMRDSLAASDITRAILPYLPSDVVISAILFDADLILPSGASRRITDTNILRCPVETEIQVSPRTVAMYTASSNVQITYNRLVTLSTP